MIIGAAAATASNLQLAGAFAFGLVLGWYLYFLNRYRKEITLADLTTVVAGIGGGAVLALFPAKTDLFGAYGVGLAVGFFGYFAVLVVLVLKSPNFDVDYLIDGRRKLPDGSIGYAPGGVDRPMVADPNALPPGL